MAKFPGPTTPKREANFFLAVSVNAGSRLQELLSAALLSPLPVLVEVMLQSLAPMQIYVSIV